MIRCFKLKAGLTFLIALFASCQNNGQLVESHFPNGNLWYSFSKDSEGRLDGPSKDFYESGVLKSSLPYSHGIIHGTAINNHPNGSVFCKAEYENGRLIEVVEYFDENGGVLNKGQFQNGNGFLLVYDRSGRLINRGSIIDGYPNGIWELMADGKVVVEIKFDHGIREGHTDKESIYWWMVTSQENLHKGVPIKEHY